MTKILVLFFIFVNFCFGAFENELSNFDKNFINSNNQEQIKFHHQLKSLYIQSVIKDDEKSKIEVLKRLIISSNALSLDDKSYASELEESGVKQSVINALREIVIKLKDEKSKAPSKTNLNNDAQITQTSNSLNKENQIKQVQVKEQNKKQDKTIDKNLTKNTSKNTQEINSKSNIKTDKIYILSSKKNEQDVELILNSNLKKEDIKNFVLDEKNNFRYIIDFEAILEGGRKKYDFNNYNVVISQYNPKTTRIVVYAKEKLPISFKLDGSKLSILISQKEKEIKKNSVQEKIKQEVSIEKKINKQEIKSQALEKKQNQKPIDKKNQKEETLYVLDVDKVLNGVVLNLSGDIDEKEINSFVSKEQNVFRQIISFKGVLEGSRKSFSFKQNTITVAQYNPKTIRIVLSGPKEFQFTQDLSDKTLMIAFQTAKNTTKTNSNKSALNSNFRSKKLIVIDAGHGGKDSGALSDKKGTLKEKNIVLSTALKLGNELKKKGYKVLYTRSTDKFINLRDRTKFANDKKADLFISIHANAAPNAKKAKSAEGVETFFLSPARSERSKKAAEKENQGDFEEINYFSKQSILNFLNREKIIASNKFAIDVQKNILSQVRKKYKVVDGGVREAPFWVLVGAQMPAILIEIGYITHPSEGKRIANKSFQDTLAKGIVDGVESYFYNNR
ncbi:N-acetylmuramoyl-L-alanine amidase [Campylobacter novaezeelandiae]|uniref:N-acetylmuramoyl-L-alanine amidase n=1 Tax=Campylobacter novaezeelandiae TaxID=2267891 RepID=UPI001037806E|nr:N-acetylmuramoyl-L-alanine amidase [Campylobacter novaezeelandiae]QWU79757.1 N-acetylmuramoyl-L-alanine amidase [Campylobacter novaezeelandiae]TBR78286.1 N-acetylmuramoyl-L-alanine amidase [Campylobacter novaezeelandiae]